MGAVNFPFDRFSTFRGSGRSRVALAWLGLLALSACARAPENLNRPKTVKASGVVTFAGQPIEGANVTFVNPDANRTAYATTDSNGRFQLMTFTKNDGAVPGPQKVAIRRVNIVDKTPPGTDLSAGGKAVPPEITWIIPEKFADVATSGLTVDVTEGGENNFTFDLK